MPLSGYSGTPLVRKLGIKAGMTVALLGAPRGFRRELVGMPADVRIVSTMIGSPDLTIWFVGVRRELEGRAASVAARVGQALWIAWPKQGSKLVTDLTGNVVRQAGLAQGLVDYKVCAINETWSGLKFARRSDRGPEIRAGRRARS